MPYIVNDALDELIDLISAWLWPGGEQDRELEEGPIGLGAASPMLQRLRVELTDEQKQKLETRLSLTRLSSSKQKVKLKRPQLALSSVVRLDNLRADGLLGRLVAQYWASARARAWYQVRCGSLTWDDDSPVWSQREKQLITDKDRKAALKNPKWFGVALSNANFLDRWDGGTSKSKLWRRRYSLEATFANWSAPPWFEWAFSDDMYFGDPYNTVDESPGRWGGKVESSGSNSIYASGQKRAPVQWEAFLSGEATFGDMMATLGDVYIFHGYKEYITNWQDRGTYANVGTGPRAHLGELPWRTFGKHVSVADRRAASYRMKNVSGTWVNTKKEVSRYYTAGYYLVRTALDVLLARGEKPQSYDGFEAHCEWWGIACPEPRMVDRYPDLSAIGGGVRGLADVSSAEIVRYVMSITPKPGTVPPWEDRGPLWTWPEVTGHMQLMSVPLQFKPRKVNNTWGTIAQYILGVEQSICANVAKGVLDEALDVIVEQAQEIAAEWLGKGVDELLGALDSKLTNAAFDAAKDLLHDVSSAYSNISRYADAEKLVGEIAGAANLPKALTKYLDGVADDLEPGRLFGLQDTVQSQIDSLRRQWDHADDLIGSAASMGSDVKNVWGSLLDE